MTDDSIVDHIYDKTNFTRIALPSADATSSTPSGSYLRLGQYVEDESSYVPGNFTKTDDGSENTPSTSNASGLFLKTDGVLFLTIDSGAYQSFGDTLSIYSASGTSMTSDGPHSITGTTVTVTSTDGSVKIESAKSVSIKADNGGVSTISNATHSTKTLGDNWSECKGTWKSLAYGRTYSAFLGSSIDFYAGDVVKNFGGLFLTTVVLFFRFTLGMEFVLFGFLRVAVGLTSILKIRTNIINVTFEYKNGEMVVGQNNVARIYNSNGLDISQENGVGIKKQTTNLIDRDISVKSTNLIDINQ